MSSNEELALKIKQGENLKNELFNNIYKLLKPNGVIICVNIRNHPYFDLFSMQKEYFKSSFEFEEFYTELRGIAKAPIKYYKYIKK